MDLLFLGSTRCIHDVGDDAPAFLLNHEVLVDCAWNAMDSLIALGEDPAKLRAVVFTHMHHDHILGLPALLFYLVQTDAVPLSSLLIAGPAEELERAVDDAMQFLRLDEFFPNAGKPWLLLLKPGDTFTVGSLDFRVGESIHNVPALAFRATDRKDHTVLGMSGDTIVHPGSVPFFSGTAWEGTAEGIPCDALIHDCAYGRSCAEPPEERRYQHSTVPEAAALAQTCGIPVLYPMHMTIPDAEKVAAEYHNANAGSSVSVCPVRRGSRVELRKNG